MSTSHATDLGADALRIERVGVGDFDHHYEQNTGGRWTRFECSLASQTSREKETMNGRNY
jgi:hypothetical protein